jgi:glycoside/pentoside/hexuronide:cation symporter, GPH family
MTQAVHLPEASTSAATPAAPSSASAASTASAPAAIAAPSSAAPLRSLLLYGAFAMPLAFAALPLYVQWPAHAASAWGMSLAVLGVLLLAVRVIDAVVDPFIGARVDGLFARSSRHAWAAAGAAAVLVAAGMAALFFAPAAVIAQPGALLAWAAVALVLTSIGYSIAQVTHQAWAVHLGGSAAEQARWVGTREALALAGVIVASLLPSIAGWGITVTVLAVLLALAWVALGRVPPAAALRLSSGPMQAGAHGGPARPLGSGRSPWREPGFRRLMAVVIVSGLASAVPASLVVLYVRDLLQAPAAAEGWVLGLYFAAAALGMPLWVRAVRRFGLIRSWWVGMWLSIAAFAGAALLGPGDLAIFAFICIASGLALGADLVVPPALLAGLIQRRDHHAAQDTAANARGVEGLWFGWWNFAMKLTLAAAAGIALPLLQWLGYRTGARDEASLAALALCYAALPCAIKALSAVLLWMNRHAWPWARAAHSGVTAR